MQAKAKKASASGPVSLSNRRAYHEYHVLETLQVGIVLTGTEIKSIRAGKASINEAHARIESGELFLYGMNISPYEQGSFNNHDPMRVRKLLIKKAEIKKWQAKTIEKGLTLIPVKLYFSKCWVKLELGLCQGKKLYDKRDAIKSRDSAREISRAMKQSG
jgi:SsrA-binding protein